MKSLLKNLTKDEVEALKKLSTPSLVQDYLESIPFNHEEGGETCMSVRRSLKEKKAHCLEGALLASAALLLQKRKPYLVSLKVTKDDYDHVITLFKEDGYWGAISKTNHAVLGFRDPVYKTVRELAMSYFHEYFLIKNGKKTMRGFSKAIPLSTIKENWVTGEDDLFATAEWISDYHHFPVTKNDTETNLRRATKLERTCADIPRDGTP